MNEINNNLALEREAELETTSGDRLKELAAINYRLADIVASNISAPPELLEKLVSHQSKAVRKAVVSNPNTSLETLFKLGAQYFPRELLNNPILQLSYLENPGFVKNIPFYTLHALLQLEEAPTFLLNHAQKGYQRQMVVEALEMHVAIAGEMSQGWHEAAEQKANYQTHYFNFLERLDYEFLSYLVEFVPEKIFKNRSFTMALARNSQTPPEILEQLARDRHTTTRTSVAGNKNTPANILKELADYSVVETREAVASNKNASVDALKKLAKDKNDTIRETVARNWSTSASILSELATDEVIEVCQEVAYNPNVSVDTLKKLAVNDSAEIRRCVARNWDTPVDLLEQLATDNSSEVRSNVGRNGNTPALILDKLARDSESIVRAGVAGNPKIPLTISELLANDRDPQVREALVGFWNQNPPIKILEEFVTHPDELIRRKVAYSHKSPENVLEALATDEDYWVRETVAGNKNTPIHILEQLAQDEDTIVRASVAERENLPFYLFEQLASDESSRVRYEVAKNSDTPTKILEILARDKNNSVYYEAVKNPQCTPEIRETIFKNLAHRETPSFLRYVLFLSDYAESSVLADNSNSISWLERYAIAQNHKTPQYTLKQLTQDGNRIVRATAKESLKKYY